MANENATPPITLRIIGALREKLNELATARSLSANRYVEDLVRNHLENPDAQPGKAAASVPNLVGLGGLEGLGGIGAYIKESTRAAQLESEVGFQKREIERLEREKDRKEEKVAALEKDLADLRKKQNMGEMISGMAMLFNNGQKALPAAGSGGIAGVEDSEEVKLVKTLKENLSEADSTMLFQIVAGLVEHPNHIASIHAQLFRPSNG